ncbi:hypothetical protein [Bradyrhizobium elkanii]|uniref:hypothetical protein n=1 Tax=Bradyrhizobium elkanii TaxID=29448 RepID=UPI0012FD265A|nr:hypothetical protein [Bradyrhizobium elkanii]
MIVGGGVAGVTAFSALAKLRCEDIKIYERASDVLALQKPSSHRLVHPNYNKWPVVEKLNIFTNFPILNWHAGPGDEVVAEIREQFKSIVADANFAEATSYGMTFEGIVKNDKNGTVAQFRNKATGALEDVSCHILIFASGFGSERRTGGHFKTYWEKPAPLSDGPEIEKPIQIFGTGDGALIDILRCYASEEKDFWKIPLGLISYFRDKKHFSILTGRASENSNRSPPPSWTRWEKEIREHELTTAPLVWQLAAANANPTLCSTLSAKEKDFYCDLMKRAGKVLTINQFLESKLKAKPSDSLLPELIGLHATPFEPTSAPINKMLLAYLVNTDRIKYTCVSKAEAEQAIDKIAKMETDEAARRINIVRIGSVAPVTSAFRLAAEDVSVLTILSGSSPPQTEHDDGLLDDSVKDQAGDDPAKYKVTAAQDRTPIVSRFFDSHFNAGEECATFEPMEHYDDGRFLIQKPQNLSDEQVRATLRDLGGLEREIFGFPLAWRQEHVNPDQDV